MIVPPGLLPVARSPSSTGTAVASSPTGRSAHQSVVFYALGFVLTQAFNGAGDTWTPTWLNLFVFWLWEIPLAYLLANVLGWGPGGAFAAITVAFSTLAVASAALFRRGKWKLKK